MTPRERFLQPSTSRLRTSPGFGPTPSSGRRPRLEWRTQGYEGPELGWHGEGLPQRFGLDELLRVDPWYGPVPEFEYQVIEEDERTRLYVNHEGILMREFKEHADTSMPQFVKFPVETAEEFEQFAAERLALHRGPALRRGLASSRWRRAAARRGRWRQHHGGRGLSGRRR